jgi:hypothetical protein
MIFLLYKRMLSLQVVNKNSYFEKPVQCQLRQSICIAFAYTDFSFNACTLFSMISGHVPINTTGNW